MIDIIMEEESDGRWSVWSLIDTTFVRLEGQREPIHAIAREIAAKGIPDQKWQVLYDGEDRVRVSGISIYRMAQLTIEESSTGLHRRTWRTYPRPGVVCEDCGQTQYMHKGVCMGCLTPVTA